MKKLKLNSIIALIFSLLVLSSCHTENKEKTKKEIVKSDSEKDQVLENETNTGKPILIIGTASILYKFWFKSSK